MYIEHVRYKRAEKTYEQILLRESYREPGAKRSAVKKRTLLNLTKYPPQLIRAIELALKHKEDLSALRSLKEVNLEQGQSVGGVFALLQVARRCGIEKALGTHQNGKLALWQVIARALFQGSRLSAVRQAKWHGAAEILGFKEGFCEDQLYENLAWLTENQEAIENRLFKFRRGRRTPELFLYDVTSSYLEGEHNALADWGYNRDKKRGKKQIVIGLLCDEIGEPVSIQVFEGNTGDLETFGDQVRKVAERFGCRRVTFVGDTSNMPAWALRRNDRLYSRLVPTGGDGDRELERYRLFGEALAGEGYGGGWPRIDPPPVPARLERLLPRERFYALCPGAFAAYRCWPVDRYARLVRWIYRRWGLTAVLCGTGAEEPTARAIAVEAGAPVVSLCGRTGLADLAAVFARAEFYVGAESGAVHLASAVETPTVCIIGGGHFGRFYPWAADGESGTGEPPVPQLPVAAEMDCFGCNWRCRFRRPLCVEAVQLEQVTAAVERLLERTGMGGRPGRCESVCDGQTGEKVSVGA